MKFCAELLLVTELAQKKTHVKQWRQKNSCCTNEPKAYAAVASKSQFFVPQGHLELPTVLSSLWSISSLGSAFSPQWVVLVSTVTMYLYSVF